jgi:hypothetical protein
MAKLNQLVGLMTIAVFIIALAFGYMAYRDFIRPAQITQFPGGGVSAPSQLGKPLKINVYLRDAFNPTNAILESTVKGRVYEAGIPDSALTSPLTAYLDSATNNGGILSFQAMRTFAGQSYKIRIWDDTVAPKYYAKVVTVNLPYYSPEATVDTYPTEIRLEAIGTFADPMQSDATGAGGTSLPTGVTSDAANNRVRINRSAVVDSTVTVRIPLTIANVKSNSVLKNVVLRPIQDTSAPLPTNVFTSVVLQYKEGRSFAFPTTDITSYVQSQSPIAIGDLQGGDSGIYYLTISLDKNSLTTGSFKFILDDLGNWLATDPVAGQSGASPVEITIQVVN